MYSGKVSVHHKAEQIKLLIKEPFRRILYFKLHKKRCIYVTTKAFMKLLIISKSYRKSVRFHIWYNAKTNYNQYFLFMSYIFFLQNVSILVPDICYMRTTLVLSKIIAKSKGFTLLDYLQYFWPFIRRVEGHINA